MQHKLAIRLVLAVSFLWCFTITSTHAAELQERVDALLSDKTLGQTVIAARIIEITGGKEAPARVLYSLRASEPMIPASVMKLATTAAALDGLGPDWKFRTYVGTLGQDLVVIGGGDPNFSGRFWQDDPVGAFRQWARALRKRNITRIRGQLILDDSTFDAPGPHPNWPQNQREFWYEAPVGALSLNDNCIDIIVAPNKQASEAAEITLSPPTKYFKITGKITTTQNRKDHLYRLQRLSGEPNINVGGKVWANANPARYFRTVEDPTAFFGAVLKETFSEEGIEISGPPVAKRVLNDAGLPPKGFHPLLVHTSPLPQALVVANKRSQGLYAECILKALAAYGTESGGAEWPKRQGTWQTGREAILKFSKKFGLPTEACQFDDGSGLSRQNRLTAIYITELLHLMHNRYEEAWTGTFSIAGRDGTLQNRMRGTAAEGRVFAKTGYVSGVSTMAGYVRSRTGRLFAFTILMNRTNSLTQARRTQDAVCKLLAEY